MIDFIKGLILNFIKTVNKTILSYLHDELKVNEFYIEIGK